MASPSRTCPRASTSRQRSASPSKAKPRSQPSAGTAAASRCGMGGAAAVVDVAAVGGVAERHHLGAEAAEQPRGVGRRGAVGGVEGDLQAGQRPVAANGAPATGAAVARQPRRQVVDVALHLGRVGGEHDVVRVGRVGAAVAVGFHAPLEGRLRRRLPLGAGGVDQLDAVVRQRVVARRDGDAGGGSEVADDPRHRRRRHHADVAPAGAAGGEAGGHPAADLRRRGAGVAAHHHLGHGFGCGALGCGAPGCRAAGVSARLRPRAAARAVTVARSSGGSPNGARTPSVPNSRGSGLIRRSAVAGSGGRGRPRVASGPAAARAPSPAAARCRAPTGCPAAAPPPTPRS